jgi:hypothetical protein
MIMAPRLRKLMLTAHITASVGWLGAVAAFLVLAIAGLMSQDGQQVRAAYLSMDLLASLLIVPLCLATLISGVVQSLGTSWGLFRHYWVLAKLFITVVSTILLLVHLRPIHDLAEAAGALALGSADFRQMRVQMAFDAGAAAIALLVTTALSVYKPRGVTPYGWRKQQEQRREALAGETTSS